VAIKETYTGRPTTHCSITVKDVMALNLDDRHLCLAKYLGNLNVPMTTTNNFSLTLHKSIILPCELQAPSSAV
jgi:hypothetical protein